MDRIFDVAREEATRTGTFFTTLAMDIITTEAMSARVPCTSNVSDLSVDVEVEPYLMTMMALCTLPTTIMKGTFTIRRKCL